MWCSTIFPTSAEREEKRERGGRGGKNHEEGVGG